MDPLKNITPGYRFKIIQDTTSHGFAKGTIVTYEGMSLSGNAVNVTGPKGQNRNAYWVDVEPYFEVGELFRVTEDRSHFKEGEIIEFIGGLRSDSSFNGFRRMGTNDRPEGCHYEYLEPYTKSVTEPVTQSQSIQLWPLNT